jgi:uncharacterized membrane protein
MELEYQATLVMILNIILPGVGTILSACFVENDPSNEHRVSLRSKLVVQGILQTVLTICLIGWLWSVFHGISVYSETKK